MKKTFPAIIIYTGLILAGIVVILFASFLVHKEEEKERFYLESLEDSDEVNYGVDGKRDGQPLESTPSMITKEYLFFQDRVLKRYYYNSEDIMTTSEILGDIYNKLPTNTNKYLMLIPMRIGLEDESYQIYSDDQSYAIDEIYSYMPQDVKTLDIFGALQKYREEYIFFRTDHAWTALGAYYGAAEFSRFANFNLIDIEEYREERIRHYMGIFGTLPETQLLQIDNDYIDYYILDDSTNQQTITARRSGGELQTYESPVVAVSRRSYDVFIGANYSHSILTGENYNGQTLMVLGDGYSKALAPWLTPYYDNVILIHLNNYAGTAGDFQNFFIEYEIKDFLVVLNVDNISYFAVIDTLKKIQEMF